MKKPDGYGEYINSPQWRILSKRLKCAAGYKCERCGQRSSTLDVHHKTYERFGKESINDLEVLCKPCHGARDKERVKQREARGNKARYNAAYHTYMTKRYGEDYPMFEDKEHVEEFDDWLSRKEENDEYYI